MVQYRRVPREEMAARHAAQRLTRVAMARRPQVVNIPVLLEMGDTVYIHFAGKPFGIPPVAWRVGQRLLDLRMRAMAASGDGILTRATAPIWYDHLGHLSALMWRHTRPVGRTRLGSFVLRFLKLVGGMRNPYRKATEAELVALTDFFLQRRMASGAGVVAANPRYYTTPSMT